jgi:hypothetical protein
VEQETSQSHPGFSSINHCAHPVKPHLVRPAAKSRQTTMINGYTSLFFLTSSAFYKFKPFTDVEIYYTANEKKIHELLTI